MPPKRPLDVIVEPEAPSLSSFVSTGGTLHVKRGGISVGIDGVRGAGPSSPVFTLKQSDLEGFADRKFMGQGSSGSVRRVRNRVTGEVYALKEIRLCGEHHLRELGSELSLLYGESREWCPYLVTFHGAFQADASVFLALECLDGSLNDLLAPGIPLLPERELTLMIAQVLRGLYYLHKIRHLVHRDIKPGNLLFQRATGKIKITDFGVSSELDKTQGDALSFVGTVTYMSPERLQGQKYQNSVDIWSLGICVIQLATGRHPFEAYMTGAEAEGKFWRLVQHLNSSDPPRLPAGTFGPEAQAFVTACLQKDPAARASAHDLLAHPWIARSIAPYPNDAEREAVVRQWLMDHVPAPPASPPAPAAAVAAAAAPPPSAAGGGDDDLIRRLDLLVDLRDV